MLPIETYKPIGIIGVALLTIGLAFVLYRWPQGKHMTFSQHLAQQKQSIVFYIGLYTIVLPISALFSYSGFPLIISCLPGS